MRSFGLVEKFFRTHTAPKCRYARPEAERVNILTLYQLQGAFWTWFVGIVTSIISFIFEVLIHKCSNFFLKKNSIEVIES